MRQAEDAPARVCQQCGDPLAPQAAFCRRCGARYEAPAAVSATPQSRRDRSNRTILWISAGILLVGVAVAAAIVTAGRGGSSSTTVITTARQKRTAPTAATAPPPTAVARVPSNSIEAGRYVQAGSFKIAADADTEQRRLAGVGVSVEVVDSEVVQQFYPGFDVLLGGPFFSATAEARLLRELHREGVPSAFARGLTPALEISDPSVVAGRWAGNLERSSSSRPRLDRSLPATLTLAPGGQRGSLELPSLHCRIGLTAAPSTTVVLSYRQSGACLGSGSWQVRPSGKELMLSLLPPGSDLIVLGTLDRS